MTPRLKHLPPSDDPVMEELATLCRRVPRSTLDAGLRARVSTKLRAKSFRAPLRLGFGTLVLLLFVAGAAVAAIGTLRPFFRGAPRSESTRLDRPSPAPPAPTVAAPPPSVSTAAVTARVPARRHASAAPIEKPARATAPNHDLEPSVEPAAAASHQDPAEESAIVHRASRALRIDHDARRAQLLLDDYLTRFPDGVVLEEALVLSIEAASELHSTRARALAQRYLAKFPAGRFVDLARAASAAGGTE